MPATRPLSSHATILPDNSLIAQIVGILDSPGLVYVEYWGVGIGRFRSRSVPSDDTNYEIHVVRLRPNTEYRYQVFGINTQGLTSDGPIGAFTTGKLPRVLRDAQFNVLSGKPTHDLTYMEFRQAGFFGLVAFDGEGQIVWYHPGFGQEKPQAMAQKPNGNIVYIATDRPGTAFGLVEINPLGVELDRLVDVCPRAGPIHHEVHLLPDGRIMYLSRDILRPGYGSPPIPQEGDTIGIWDQVSRENTIVWTIYDFISPIDRTIPGSNLTLPSHPMWGGCDADEAVQDWSHANSTSVDSDGSILISLRNLNQIVSISPDFQSTLWRLGGPGSDFTFPQLRDQFYHQHAAVPLPNGNVLLFDNGNFRPGKEGGGYSRALELELDFDTMEATKVWEYRHDPDIFSACCSNVHRLENGNTLILFGLEAGDLCCRRFTIVEADPDGEVAWEVEHISPGKFLQYRVYPADSIWGEVLVSD